MNCKWPDLSVTPVTANHSIPIINTVAVIHPCLHNASSNPVIRTTTPTIRYAHLANQASRRSKSGTISQPGVMDYISMSECPASVPKSMVTIGQYPIIQNYKAQVTAMRNDRLQYACPWGTSASFCRGRQF
ncbi:hypothetical protein RRG08_036559 [Elysia crispata]|uniref:Uncharacterized protein n=1 Tax=Elysia crispata TaxID=231223 RepID=A0AAE0XXV1_9GAST|nr:hypothetical protein RRG08_036559 [Elysia crispata]